MEYVVFPLFLSELLVYSNAVPTSGPFDIIFKDVAHCPEPSTGIAYDLKMTKVSRKKLALALNASLIVPIDDELSILINMAKQTNQGWKENFFILEFPKACTTLKAYVPELERALAEQMKLTGCPFPVGNYSATISLEIDLRLIPSFPYGKYRSKVNYLKNRKRVFCIHGLIDVIPRRSG